MGWGEGVESRARVGAYVGMKLQKVLGLFGGLKTKALISASLGWVVS